MLRRALLDEAGGWHERGWAEDLDLWLRLLERGVRFDKLPRALYGWRQHAGSSTRVDPRYARERFTALKIEHARSNAARRGPSRHARGHRREPRALAGRHGRAGGQVRDARNPAVALFAGTSRPWVLVYLSPLARQRWRERAAEAGMSGNV